MHTFAVSAFEFDCTLLTGEFATQSVPAEVNPAGRAGRIVHEVIGEHGDEEVPGDAVGLGW